MFDWIISLEAFISAVVGGAVIVGWVSTRKKVRDEPTRLTRFERPREVLDVVQFLRTQQKLRDELKAELEDAHAEDRARLQARIDVLTSRIAEPEKSLAEAQKRIADLEDILEREGNEIGADRLTEARDALNKGDYSIADELFAEIEARQEFAVQQAARAAYGRGEVAEAEVRWLDAAVHFVRAAELEPSFDHLYKAQKYLWLAGHFAESLGVAQKLLAPDVSNTSERQAIALNEYALSLYTAGSLDEAEPLYRKALEIDRETLGERHPAYAIRLNNLAMLLEATSRDDDAEALYREALEIDRETYGVWDSNYAIGLNNLAALLKKKGRYDEAEPLHRESLEITRETVGERHPNYASCLNNLALLLEATGRFDQAEPPYRQAVDIADTTLGPNHPTTKKIKQNLANLLNKTPSD